MEQTRKSLVSPTGFVLEQMQRLSGSILWKLQRGFFHRQGVRAWSQGPVPHYITSNAFIADGYARVVFGFLRDCHAVTPTGENPNFLPLDLSQPVYIIELGAGSGRFAFHFMKKFLSVFS